MKDPETIEALLTDEMIRDMARKIVQNGSKDLFSTLPFKKAGDPEMGMQTRPEETAQEPDKPMTRNEYKKNGEWANTVAEKLEEEADDFEDAFEEVLSEVDFD